MRLNIRLLPAFLLLLGLTSCEEFFDRFKDVKPRQTEVTEFAAQLKTPFGIEVDSRKQVWVAEAGTGTGNTGQISLITPQGVVYPVITGFASTLNPEGTAYGLTGLKLQDGILWILHGVEGRLYRFDINEFEIGDEPFEAGELAYDDIAAFVGSYPFPSPIDHMDPFNLTVGPGGDLFIVESGANAIIRRQAGTGTLSVFAIFDDLPNPTQVGPPTIDAVPTGIVYDGHRFLVSSLTGFPFPEGKANIYQVDQAGNVSVYQSGFSTLTGIELGLYNQPLVIQFGVFGPEGPVPNSGRLLAANKTSISPIIPSLSFPTAIKKADPKNYYIGSFIEGKIYKLTYY
jgi:hypothetical protein